MLSNLNQTDLLELLSRIVKNGGRVKNMDLLSKAPQGLISLLAANQMFGRAMLNSIHQDQNKAHVSLLNFTSILIISESHMSFTFEMWILGVWYYICFCLLFWRRERGTAQNTPGQ